MWSKRKVIICTLSINISLNHHIWNTTQFVATYKLTYCCLQAVDIWVIRRSVSEDFSQQQRVFHQAWARYVQEAPEVQFPAEGRLQAALQEVLHSSVLLLLVQQGFGCELIAAVVFVGVQTWQLRKRSKSFYRLEDPHIKPVLKSFIFHPGPQWSNRWAKGQKMRCDVTKGIFF